MFRALIPPIFRSTRLCVTTCVVMHPKRCRPVVWKLHFQTTDRQHLGALNTSSNTQSSAPEDVWDQRPKHVELIGIINKPLVLHVVGVYIMYINDTRSNKYQIG